MQKYGISEVVYLEHDPGIIAAEGARDTVAGTMEINVEKADPLRYMRKTTGKFDAVIQLIPPPSTIAVNRFYTIEYFTLVKEHLTPGGIFVCTPMPWYNYSPESYRRGLSPVYNALGDLFRHVVVIPGSSLYLIASDYPLSDSVSVMAERHSIGNTYVNGDYIDDDDIRRKGRQIISVIDAGARVNSAALPVSSWFNNLLSLEKKGIAGSSVALLVILIILPFVFAGRGGLMMFSSSAALAGCFLAGSAAASPLSVKKIQTGRGAAPGASRADRAGDSSAAAAGVGCATGAAGGSAACLSITRSAI